MKRTESRLPSLALSHFAALSFHPTYEYNNNISTHNPSNPF